ncbi:MAG TPA: rhodanese-like domain-containing protein [Candidatus Sulfomarinibacteraceae bacterium]|nr:rhodanese-like domain-containing protein [Methylomirabilota bacterium]HSN54666.1 rhodanese-like domain-containing protein [Candidatus Sulfomarinibacteraceae bacterium]
MDRMNLETLKSKLKNDNIALFDVRGDDAYEIEHIPGAKTVPLTAIRERVDGLVDRDTEIVVYGERRDSESRREAVRILEEMGYENVSTFREGLEGWKEAGLDVNRRREHRA